MKYLKLFLNESLLDTTILLTTILFINIGFLLRSNFKFLFENWWNFCFYYSIPVWSNFIIILSIFIYGFKFFYNFLNL